MFRTVTRVFMVGLLTVSLAGAAFADQVMGTISKVEDEGREITVKDKGGKEVSVKISGSRTKLEGVKSRDALKEGQSVTIEHEKGEANTVKVGTGK